MPALKSALGNVSEGPQRWVRARENAAVLPNSKGGKLYRKREKIAAELKQQMFAHQRQAFTVLRALDIDHRRTRKIHICSVECLGFQMQLETGDTLELRHYSSLVADALSAQNATAQFEWSIPGRTYVRTLAIQTLDASRLERPVSCRVCGASMVGDKQTVAGIAAVTDKTKQYVLVEGEFMLVGDMKVVNLTARDYELLNCYSTPDLRASYVYEFGHRLDA